MSDHILMRGERVVGQKVLCTFSLPVDLAQKIAEYSPNKGDKSALIVRALIPYFQTHDNPLNRQPTPVNITIEAKAEKTEEVRCEVNKCKEKAVTSGLYKGKEYQLCTTHAHGYSGVKGWLIK